MLGVIVSFRVSLPLGLTLLQARAASGPPRVPASDRAALCTCSGPFPSGAGRKVGVSEWKGRACEDRVRAYDRRLSEGGSSRLLLTFCIPGQGPQV